MLNYMKLPLLNWLAEKGVTILNGVKYEEITDKGLVVTTMEGKRQIIEADSVLVATPPSPNEKLFKTLEGKVIEIRLIGDCREPRLIENAIYDGFQIGSSI